MAKPLTCNKKVCTFIENYCSLVQKSKNMRLLKKILILTIIFISGQAYCCDCKDLGQLDSLRLFSFNNSELVFLGELIEFDT